MSPQIMPPRAAPRARSVIATAILIGATVLAGTVPGLTTPTPSPPIRITLVSHSWADEDFTLADDAVYGLGRLKAAAGDRRVTLKWIPLYRGSDTSPAGRKAAYADALTRLRDATRSSDIVIAWGDLLTGPVLTIAPEFPRVRFGLVSAVYVERLPPNVVEGVFRVEEEAFLAGAVAALLSTSRTVGYIGAYESYPRRIGFAAGVYYASPNVRVIVDHVGYQATSVGDSRAPAASQVAEASFEPSRHDARKAEEVARSQYDRGVDVIYAAAGGSDAGAYEAATKQRRWVIGTGGRRTEGTLPARWQRQIFAVVSEHSELAANQLGSQLLASSFRLRHVAWGLTYPGAPMIMIDYTTHKQQFDRLRPYTAGLISEIGLHRVKVPYNRPQLADFMKEFPP